MEKKLELPVYLFHQGTAVSAYELMGAHPETRKKRKGYVFRVWAPNAEQVYLIGEFNGWKDTHPMKKLTNQGIWELFVPDLEEFTMYKFSMRDAFGNRNDKCDPYGYHMETTNGTASKIYNLEGYRWKDKQWRENKREIAPMNVYEVHLGSWKAYPDGNRFDYKALTEELVPYAKEMGYTHIQLMPVSEYPYDCSLGYQSIGFYAVTSRFGTPKELMGFVDACHAAEIGVILDWVPAAFPKDLAGLYRFDGSPCYESADPLKGEYPEWGTMAFDWGRNEVRSFLLSNAIFWLDKFHFDGLHLEGTASLLYLDHGRREGEWRPNRDGGNENYEGIELLTMLNRTVAKAFPDAVMVAGETGTWANVTGTVEEGGLGFHYKWDSGWKNDTLTYMMTDSLYRQYKHSLMTHATNHRHTEKFVLPLSHDDGAHVKGSLINKMPGEYEDKFANLRTYLGFMMTHPGKKLLFMGNELAQFNEWHYEGQLDWNLLEFDMHEKFRNYVKDLNHLYIKHREFWALDEEVDGFSWINSDDNQNNIYSYIRTDGQGSESIVICNFAPVAQSKYRIGVNQKASYKLIFNSDHEIYGGKGKAVKRIRTEQTASDGREYSIVLDIPPMSMLVLKAYHK